MSQNTFEPTTELIIETPNYEPIQTEPEDLSIYKIGCKPPHNENLDVVEDLTEGIQTTDPNEKQKIKNRGTGAGGSNTNKNGLPYEEITTLIPGTRFKHIRDIPLGKKTIQEVDIDGNTFIKLTKGELKNYMITQKEYIKNEKSLQPDECYLDEKNKILNIIEKKFQQTYGSVDEKIQTAEFKKWFYEKQYPNYTIKYCYCLSDWFKQDKYKPDLEFNKIKGFEVFWGKDDNYQGKIMDWLVNNL